MNDAKCACLNVKYMPVEYSDGRKEERWMCLECKSIFKKENANFGNAVLADVLDDLEDLVFKSRAY